MATLFSDNILTKEVKRLNTQKAVFMNFVTREYEWELKGKNSIVFVPVISNITLTGSNITWANWMQLWTWPGQAITASPTVLSLEPLTLSKYAPYRTQLTDFEIKHSKVAIEMTIADNLTNAEQVLMDNFVRDLILVDKIASIPAANKINSASPVTITVSNVVEEFWKMSIALDKTNTWENRVLFVSPATADLFFQAKLLANVDAAYSEVQKNYLATYRNTKIVMSNALTASNEMIMMEVWAVNAVAEYYALESRDGADWKYTNLISEMVYGWTIFSTNLPKIAVNYCA